MISTFDMKNFGSKLKAIRDSLCWTRADVAQMTGINEDTIYKIENGKVLPRYETLEILSYAYNLDLLHMLAQNRTSKLFFDFDKMLDELIYNFNERKLTNIRKQFVKIKNDIRTQSVYNKINIIEQYELFLLGVEHYNSHLFHESISVLEAGIRKRNRIFSITNWKSYKYSFLEVRMLILIALSYTEIGNIEISNEILDYCRLLLLDAIESNYTYVYILIKIIYNLSYNAHLSNNNELALNYTILGIDICKKYRTNYCITYLLMRRGVAEYLLGIETFYESFKAGILLLELFDEHEIAIAFKSITKEKYNIDL